MNWRSVACSAVSGMLLMRPMVTTRSLLRLPKSLSSSRRSVGASEGLTISRCLSNRSAMPARSYSLRRLQPPARGARLRQRLIDILDDVGNMLDSDGQPNRFGQDAGHALLLRRHLAVGC